MSAIEPIERRLRNLYLSPKPNRRNNRLEIANIFRRTNFGLGNEGKLDSNLIVFRRQISKVLDYRAFLTTSREAKKIQPGLV